MKKSINVRNGVLIFAFIFVWALDSISATLPEKQTEGLSIASINIKVNTIEKNLDYLSKIQTEDVANEGGAKKDQIEEKRKALVDLQSAYTSLKEALIGFEKVKKEQQTILQIYEDYQTRGMPQKPPYSLTFHDSIQAEISAAIKNQQNKQLAIGIVKKNIEEYQKHLEQKESELRQFLEKNGKPDQQRSEKKFEREVKELSVEQLKILLQAFDVEKKSYETENSNADIYIKQLKEQEAYVSLHLQYDKSDLDHQLELNRKKEAEIQKEIKKIKSEQGAIETEWIKSQQNMTSAFSEQERKIAQAYLKAREEWRKTYIVVLELKQDSLKLIERQIIIWQTRYDIVRSDLSFDRKKEIYDETQKNIDSLKQTLQIQQNFLINLQNQISAIENLIQEEGTLSTIVKHLGVEKEALKRQFERRLEFQSMIITTDQVEQNLLSMVKEQVGKPNFKDQITGAIQIIKKTWNFEIWVVDQNSVSVGKIFTALIILVIGILLARFVVHFIHRRLLNNSQVKDTTASAIHKALSYFAYLMVFLLALRIVNIPLTAFAFLGGAIAIGIGFGAQNLINNFISGFIILGERPIQIGDLIEVDGLLGKVEEIGARCTRVRTGENVHKLIPNSSFLEKNITNWTLSDNRIRTKIIVGVAYGSPVKIVEQVLIRSAKSNKNILQTPEPFVLFSDFGDNSLIFEVYFWVMVRAVLERKEIESQIRFEIDAQFKQEGIVIAFPQMDLHFDSDNQLNIKLIGQSPPMEKSGDF